MPCQIYVSHTLVVQFVFAYLDDIRVTRLRFRLKGGNPDSNSCGGSVKVGFEKREVLRDRVSRSNPSSVFKVSCVSARGS